MHPATLTLRITAIFFLGLALFAYRRALETAAQEPDAQEPDVKKMQRELDDLKVERRQHGIPTGNYRTDPFYRELYAGVQVCKKVSWSPGVMVNVTPEAWSLPKGSTLSFDYEHNRAVEVPHGYLGCDHVEASAAFFAEGTLEVMAEREEVKP